MKAVVTGANGFIGHAICAALLARGSNCVGMVRRAQAVEELPAGTTPLVLPDYADEAAVRAALPDGDCLIHCAGLAHVLSGDREEEAYRQSNVRAPIALAQAAAARGYQRFVFLSSIGVLGAQDPGAPLTEESPPAPARAYAQSKLEAEQALFAIGRATGMQIVVLRPPMVYGPGNRGNFPRLMRWVRSGLPIPLGLVRNQRSYVYVGNLADAALTCASHPGAADRLFLVSDMHDWSTPELVRLIARAMARPARLWPVPVGLLQWLGRVSGKSREVHSLTDSLRIDCTRLRQATGWQPPHAAEEGVALTVRWFETLGQQPPGRHKPDAD